MATLSYAAIISICAAIAVVMHWLLNRKSLLTSWPIFGMIPALARNMSRVHDFATYILQQAGGTFLFKGPWFTAMDLLITSDPNNVDYLLNKNYANYQKGPMFRETCDPLGDGIIAADSDNWRFLRRITHSLINQDLRYDAAIERILDGKILKRLYQVLDNASEFGSEVDLQDVIQRLTFDGICLLLLGYDPKCLAVGFPHNALEKAFHEMEQAVHFRHAVPTGFWKLKRWLQMGEEKKMRRSWDLFEKFVMDCITTKREEIIARNRTPSKNQTEDSFDMLTAFLEEEDEGEDVAITNSNKFLRDMTFNLMAAGRDTISSAMVWLLWVIASNPSIEKKILDELNDNYKEATNNKMMPLSIAELNKLIYFQAVVLEAIRLYPPIPFLATSAIEPDVLPSGHYVGKDMKIIYSFYSMGRMEEIWGKDYLEFKPERWITEQGSVKHVPSYRFSAFSAGLRSCLGKKTSFQQIKAVASFIIWNFSIRVSENHIASPSNSVILFMRNGLRAILASAANRINDIVHVVTNVNLDGTESNSAANNSALWKDGPWNHFTQELESFRECDYYERYGDLQLF
ncbi:alkane hydroxylase MAH1-like [Mercurialis annua]|uniref:alkane hydroxylase MAH1-like n=1 Tax=Mercurialis annua TaxID=3986 RepID=UPI00215FC749|nr:alkane hydroxylase MAH1-like [Mercurialis annua]